VYRLGRRAYKNMTVENSLYNTIILSTMDIIPNKIQTKFETSLCFPCPIYSNAERSNI
jgi:hypothetical protein